MFRGLLIICFLTCVLFVCILIHRELAVKILDYSKKCRLRVYISAIVFLLTDFLALMVENNIIKSQNIVLCYAFNMAVHISMLLLIVFWFIYTESYRISVFPNYKPKFLMISIFFDALTILVLTTPFHKLVFYYDENLVYHRSRFFLIYQLIMAVPMILSTIKILLLSFNKNAILEKKSYRMLAIFPLFPVIGRFIQDEYKGMPFLSFIITLSCIFLYLQLNENMITTDALTGLNNRLRFDAYITETIEAMNHFPMTGAFLMLADIDRFKLINDGFGHIEGDNALRNAAKILKETIQEFKSEASLFLARYGGDEFAIIARTNDDTLQERIIEAIQKRTDKLNENQIYKIVFSIGAANYTTKYKTPAEFIAEADRKMYNVKEAHHAIR